jgi:hypothetical protein
MRGMGPLAAMRCDRGNTGRHLSVAQSLIDAANRLEMRELAARQDVSKIKMSDEARALFKELRAHVLALDSDALELAEPNSVSYHGPDVFLEVLPRRYSLWEQIPGAAHAGRCDLIYLPVSARRRLMA